MILHDLYAHPEMWGLPYRLLTEREPSQNISHHTMPTWEEHCAYVGKRPYEAWYWFESPAGFDAGCAYLTRQREIGVFVLKAHRRQGLGREAVLEVLRRHPGRILANINPANEPSLRLFTSLGFGQLQVTYVLDNAEAACSRAE